MRTVVVVVVVVVIVVVATAEETATATAPKLQLRNFGSVTACGDCATAQSLFEFTNLQTESRPLITQANGQKQRTACSRVCGVWVAVHYTTA